MGPPELLKATSNPRLSCSLSEGQPPRKTDPSPTRPSIEAPRRTYILATGERQPNARLRGDFIALIKKIDVFRTVVDHVVQDAFALRNDDRHQHLARHIDCRAPHVEDRIDR